ncbi:MAG: amidohydrolase family protein [Thioalkalivibrio sp.]|nr:amidohydrolase family protein [Thioalkalivibrio sp.]
MADHHVHVLSPELVRDWKSLGVPFSRPDSAYTSVEAIFQVRPDVQAFLVSMAHIYGSEEFRGALGLSLEEEHARVRRANDHVAQEVARAPQRFVGFCSVSLLRPYAASEIERCRSELELVGLKLHLPSSGVRLGNRQHRRMLAEVAARAEQEQRPLLLHLVAAEREIEEEEVRGFVDEVVRPHPQLELYLAHMGGNGGYRISAQRVVDAFVAFFAEGEALRQRPIYFELSASLLTRQTDGVPASSGADIQVLARDLRQLGLQRVLFGSDYPVFDGEAYSRALREHLPLSSAEFTQVLGNRGPALKSLPGQT